MGPPQPGQSCRAGRSTRSRSGRARADNLAISRLQKPSKHHSLNARASQLCQSRKKHDRGWGGRRMRYPASEKLEIIRLVEQSHLPVRRTLEKLGIPRATFYRWYDLYQSGGPEALEDRPSKPNRVWNRIPDEIRRQIIALALDQPELSPRELAVRFTDEQKYFVSEASVYRLVKAHDLITCPAFIVVKAADVFKDKTT